VDCRFVRDSEFGWGRYDPASGIVIFFDSPVSPEVSLPATGRAYKAAQLPAQQRVWWFDQERWIVGRIDSPRDTRGDAYYVHLPNGSTKIVLTSELRVRWSVPLADPLRLLKAGTVETRFYHLCRTPFLRSVLWQRSTSLGLGGILSAAVEIHDHQVGAARRVLADPIPRYLLADEVGLGKTIEAGMVLRQLLLDTGGDALVIVPDQIVGQWKRELADKFRVDFLPGFLEVAGHSAIGSLEPEPRVLTIVDEAHRLTERVDYGGDGDRDRQYEALRAIAHASTALLLLSATPVRTNEDAFLGLLHLLDPVNYRLTDLDGFRRRVEMRDDLAQAMSAIGAETPLRYLDEPLTDISRLLDDDPDAGDLVAEARQHIAARAEGEARAAVSQLRIYLSETYRLHRRMVRNRRSTAVKKGFPARGRELAHPWLIPDPDERRQDLFGAFDDLRLGLEAEEIANAGSILQIVLGRILAPMTALEDLAAALRGESGHDLSAEELAAVNELARTDTGREFYGELAQVLAMTTASDRLSAAVAWAQRRVGSRKCAIACTFPRTARLTAGLLTRELGAHRVTALLEAQGEDERFRRAIEFEQGTELKVVVLDRSAEEGANLQFVEDVLHLNVPVFTTHLEQRLGRFDRWSELPDPVRSTTFEEAFPLGHEHIDAWTMTLNDVFGVFTSSTSTLQYVLADLEREFFRTAVPETLAGARKLMLAQTDMLTKEERRIAGQDLLDSIEDRTDGEDLAKRIDQIDSTQRVIAKVVDGYLADMLQFSVHRGEDGARDGRAGDRWTRYGVSKSRPPLLTEETIRRRIGTRVFDQRYTADRMAAVAGLGFLRWGEPLVNAFAGVAQADDRGKAFAVEVRRLTGDQDREPGIAFCFDVKIAPGPVDSVAAAAIAADPGGAFRRAVESRTEFFLPTTIERVWWLMGQGECKPQLVQQLDQVRGENLGSRPDRFRELTAPYDWPGVCDDVLGKAMAAVHKRDRVIRRLAEARTRSASARTRESVIRRVRSRGERESPPDDVLAAVEHALDHPVFSLDSCGAVFISWVYQP
jgi:ATP-dependent helicase HepA